MKRKPYPHEDLVQEIRKQIRSQDYSFISDDHDMYYTKDLGGDPSSLEWRDFRPLRLSREEDWSDWLAHLIASSRTGDFSRRTVRR